MGLSANDVTEADRDRWRRLSPYLDRALSMTAQDRAALLRSLHAKDAALAATLQRMLEERSQLSRNGYLEGGLVEHPSPVGEKLGPYTLVAPIGRGGMGSVWLARRHDGRFEGTAAVKLLDLSLLGQGGEERFRREGSILARLKHPNVAQLLDAGVSAGGQPYLVLEHVEGVHIDTYCADHDLGLEARLHLVLDVLAGLAHAHANLIVHRDIKPSNVLVGTDGRARLLDFGIAKLLEPETAVPAPGLTREGGAAMTPLYAAPEQLGGGTITTATDVYGVGLLLYLLLSGRHPRGDSVSTAELYQRIQTEPPPLSSAVTSDRTRRRLRGDLDTIVAKALKQAPGERYAQAAEMAEDLRRFLANQPIGARPDSFGYRAGKFVRRHARLLAAGVMVTLLLAGILVFHTARLSWERNRARFEADRATKVSELLTDLLSGADPYRDEGKELTVSQVLATGVRRVDQELASYPELQAEMLRVVGRAYRNRAQLTDARPLLERALKLAHEAAPGSELVGSIANELGALSCAQGRFEEAEPLLEEALAIRRQRLGNDHKDVAVSLVELARVYDDRGFVARATPLLEESLSIRRRILGREHRETATSLSDLGLNRRSLGDLRSAEALLRESLEINEKALPPDHPNTASSRNNLALVLADQDRFAEAEVLFRRSLEVDRRALGEGHPEYAVSLNNLTYPLIHLGKNEEAAGLLEQALAIVRPKLGDGHPLAASFKVNLARTLLARRQAAAAEPLLRQALQVRRRVLPAGDWKIGVAESLLGEALTAQGRYPEAERSLQQARALIADLPGPRGREFRATAARLTALYRAWGQSSESERMVR